MQHTLETKNLHKALVSAAAGKSLVFKESVEKILASKILKAVNEKKKEVSEKMFGEEKEKDDRPFAVKVNDFVRKVEDDKQLLPLKKGDKVKVLPTPEADWQTEKTGVITGARDSEKKYEVEIDGSQEKRFYARNNLKKIK